MVLLAGLAALAIRMLRPRQPQDPAPSTAEDIDTDEAFARAGFRPYREDR